MKEGQKTVDASIVKGATILVRANTKWRENRARAS